VDRLPAAEVQFQAEKLLDFTRRGGSAAAWWASKDFSAAERVAIQEAAGAAARGGDRSRPAVQDVLDLRWVQPERRIVG